MVLLSARKPPLRLPATTHRAWRAAEDAGAAGYIDPATGLFAMTEAGLRARGACCGSACRHCPYDWAAVPPGRLARFTVSTD